MASKLKPTRRDLPRGIRRTPYGFQANVGVRGHTKWRRFKPTVAIEAIQAWRERQRTPAMPPATAATLDDGTLASDAARYLPARAAMVSIQDRRRELKDWIAIFGGDRRRRSITPLEIQTQRDAWVVAGKSPSWINHRLYALSNLWAVLDGRRAVNPAREVKDVDMPDLEPRGLSYDIIRAILGTMPDRGPGVKDQKRGGASKTKARLAVIAYTGLAHTQLKRLQPEDIDWATGTIFLRSRKKGPTGRPNGRVKPITREGLAALKRFAALDCWGAFSNAAMRHSFRRACDTLTKNETFRTRWPALNLAKVRPYDLRHSYATIVLATTGSLADTQALMGHASERTTLRYAYGAVAAHLAQAVGKVRFEPIRRRKVR